MQKLAIIGAGAMGSAFAKGVIGAGLVQSEKITLSDINQARLDMLVSELGVNVTTDNASAIKDAKTIIIAVKPMYVAAALESIADVVKSDQLVISIAAGVKLELIESYLPREVGVIRVMPNTPCMIGAGAIGFSRGKSVTGEQAADAQKIFEAVGIAFEVPEKQLDAVTGLSGSGPAYIYVLIEALSDAGVRVGLPRAISTKLAAQTVMGAAKMVLDENEHPAVLKDQVTSPGGTTIAGIDALEQAGFRSALIEAVKAATKRSEELG